MSLFFSRLRLKWYFSYNVFPPCFLVFLAQNQIQYKVGEIRKYDEKTEYFEKKNAFILNKKVIFNKIGGAKYPGGRRVFCLSIPTTQCKSLDCSASESLAVLLLLTGLP